MTNTSSNLRKAAVFLRSVDADTAASLLAQLSTEEAAAIREAIRQLGPLDPEEQADVVAEFRRERPFATEPVHRGVELAISSSGDPHVSPDSSTSRREMGKRFEFLEVASASTLASHLAREHAQTIAVVLSHLVPDRAASVLAALPEKVQTETMQRLSNLGDTNAEVVTVLERELSDWVKRRGGESPSGRRHRDTVASILAAADLKTREAIVANLKKRDAALADALHGPARVGSRSPQRQQTEEYRIVRSIAKRQQVNQQLRSLMPSQAPTEPEREPQPETRPTTLRPALPRIEFDHLIHLDTLMLSRLLAVADPTVLALALVGSRDDLVDRICDQMPKRVAKSFRRELRRMGPTRLSDVEAAQRVIAEIAAGQLAEQRQSSRRQTNIPLAATH